MNKVLSFLKDNALFESMLVGFAFGGLEVAGIWRWPAPHWALPSLIFLMLFFTFCKINPLDLRLHKWHWIILVFQIIVSLLLFVALSPIDMTLAQGVMLCVLMPSATAAPIIAGKLGGSIQSLTSYTLLSNLATAILVPLIFPYINPDLSIPFAVRFLQILRHVSPLLLGPFLSAWALRLVYDGVQKARHSEKRFRFGGFWAQVPFWVWVFTLVILMAKLVVSLAAYEGPWYAIAGLFIGALLTCMLQFYVGKRVGEHWPSKAHGEDYHDVLMSPAIWDDDPRQITRISAGQALGQKNTTLAIWMATTYLHPVSSLAPAAYIIWQNMFNSWQLSRAAKGHKA